jgi:hypothetical protein
VPCFVESTAEGRHLIDPRGSYCAALDSVPVSNLIAMSAKAHKFIAPARLYVYETILGELVQDLEDMAAEPGECIQEAHAMVGQRHVAWHRHVAPTDQPCIREGMVGCARRAGRDPRRTVYGKAGDVVDARGLDGLSEGHRRQDGGEPPCQHRLPHPAGPEHERLWLKCLHPISLYPKGSCWVLVTDPLWWYAQMCIPTVSGHCRRTSWVYAQRVRLERFQDALRFGQCQAEVLNLSIPLSMIATSCTRTSRASFILAKSLTLDFMGSPPVRMLRIGGPIVPPCQSSAPAF